MPSPRRREKSRRELDVHAEVLFTIGTFNEEYVEDWRRHGARLLRDDPHRYRLALEAYGPPWPSEESDG